MTFVYKSNVTLAQAVDQIRAASRIVVTTHAKPDGDALGCVLAMTRALELLGKTAHGILIPPVPGSLQALRGADRLITYDGHAPLPECDLVMVLDTGAWSQLWSLDQMLRPVQDKTLILDHHQAGDVQAAWRFVDVKAAACCEIVAQVIDLLDNQSPPGQSLLDAIVCDALFVGIAADTGWFRFSNTRSQTHELAARLLQRGVDHAGLYAELEQAERPQKLALFTRGLQNLRYLAGGQVALMVLRADDFAAAGAGAEETERLVDVPQIVGNVQMVVLISQPPQGTKSHPDQVRISFRSKPGPQAVDVSELASRWGGGGHSRAAAARVGKPIDQVVSEVSTAIEAHLGSHTL